jgi:3-oxoadipate enol-lactonase
MSARERSVTVGGSALRYTRIGDGDAAPLLLLHPWFGCAAFWDEVAARLTGRPRLVLDLYSLGEGDWSDLAGPPGLARAVLALLDAEGIESCALAGNSTGGVAAQLVAITAPDRVAALVLIGTGASTGGVPADYRAEIDAWLESDLDGSRSAALVRRLLSRDPPSERMAVYVDAVRRADRDYMVRTLEGVLELDLRPRLGAIAARTLIVRGERDAARTREHVRTLLAGIDGSVAIELAGAGHSPMVDSPEALLRLLQAFLDGRPVPGAGRELLDDAA